MSKTHELPQIVHGFTEQIDPSRLDAMQLAAGRLGDLTIHQIAGGDMPTHYTHLSRTDIDGESAFGGDSQQSAEVAEGKIAISVQGKVVKKELADQREPHALIQALDDETDKVIKEREESLKDRLAAGRI